MTIPVPPTTVAGTTTVKKRRSMLPGWAINGGNLMMSYWNADKVITGHSNWKRRMLTTATTWIVIVTDLFVSFLSPKNGNCNRTIM